MAIMLGSARIDENGKATGGNVGDQKQVSASNDTRGEVSMQAFYNHSKGWRILRAKNAEHARKLAEGMTILCNNPNVGYDQSNRLGVVKYGINTKVKTEGDCSSSVRACIIYATGRDVGNFTTYNEKNVLVASGLFDYVGDFVSQAKTPVYDGDVLTTKTKGHTVIVVSGNPRTPAFDWSPVFDATYYANRYPDLRSAGLTTPAQLLNHFVNNGMKERRQACDSFNVEVYRNRYPDLQKAFGEDWVAYYKHFCTNGKAEGRTAI